MLPSFLDLPRRSTKPRHSGLTHVIDRGLSVAQVDGLVEVTGGAVDLVKLGWGTAFVTENLEDKLARYRHHGIAVVLGGTLTELAIAQGRLDELLAWIEALGIRHVEISDGTIPLPGAEKVALIERLSSTFTVLSEVGSKSDAYLMQPDEWVEQIGRDLQAGAWKVITEARESGTAGIFRSDGAIRAEVIDAISEALPVDRVLFEAPQKVQQIWFVERFGANVNLGNVAPQDVLALETLRLGLRSDTMPRTLEVRGSHHRGQP